MAAIQLSERSRACDRDGCAGLQLHLPTAGLIDDVRRSKVPKSQAPGPSRRSIGSIPPPLRAQTRPAPLICNCATRLGQLFGPAKSWAQIRREAEQEEDRTDPDGDVHHEEAVLNVHPDVENDASDYRREAAPRREAPLRQRRAGARPPGSRDRTERSRPTTREGRRNRASSPSPSRSWMCARYSRQPWRTARPQRPPCRTSRAPSRRPQPWRQERAAELFRLLTETSGVGAAPHGLTGDRIPSSLDLGLPMRAASQRPSGRARHRDAPPHRWPPGQVTNGMFSTTPGCSISSSPPRRRP